MKKFAGKGKKVFLFEPYPENRKKVYLLAPVTSKKRPWGKLISYIAPTCRGYRSEAEICRKSGVLNIYKGIRETFSYFLLLLTLRWVTRKADPHFIGSRNTDILLSNKFGIFGTNR
eukprot:GEMP01016434.1.p2 GENE.GEMP01016434.1~~GEMP01016434.1.p2  ORF type:complete len:116 (-),score=0.04 GEMP01016434.1:2238-2585(-)